jgi:hypothetical protein
MTESQISQSQIRRKLELKQELTEEEYYFYCNMRYTDKINMRFEYERINYPSDLVNLFFKNLGIILLYLSMNQVEKLRLSLGTISRDFFECTDLISLLNAAVSPLFNTKKYKKTDEEAHDAAVKAQAAAKTKATEKAKAFAECMAAKANVVSSIAAKAEFLKSVADKATDEAEFLKSVADKATDEATDEARDANHKARDANHKAKDANDKARDANDKARVVKTSTDEKYKGTGQIRLFSGEFNGMILERKRYTMDKNEKPNSKFKCCIEKYDPTHLKLAEAILEVAIFILQNLLPRSVDDEESYKQSLRRIGIIDEKSVKKLASVRSRDIDELRHLSSKIKAFFRNGIMKKRSIPPKPKAFHQDVVNCLTGNQDFMNFIWNTCDECQRPVDHLGLWPLVVRCTECGGECPILGEPTPAQVSDHLQALATELIDAKISFGEPAEKIANVLLENGVSQLSELFVLGEETFASIVKNIGFNELQVLKLSAFRKK